MLFSKSLNVQKNLIIFFFCVVTFFYMETILNVIGQTLKLHIILLYLWFSWFRINLTRVLILIIFKLSLIPNRCFLFCIYLWDWNKTKNSWWFCIGTSRISEDLFLKCDIGSFTMQIYKLQIRPWYYSYN